MRDLLPTLDRWRVEGKEIALATVIRTWGSAPRLVGSKMVIASDGQFSGSVSGGCVENAVMEAALDTIKTGRVQLLHFGVADETAWQVGLACGGSIDIFVEPLEPAFLENLRAAWMGESRFVQATFVRGSAALLGQRVLVQEDGTVVGTIDHAWRRDVLKLAAAALSQGKSQPALLDEGTEIFLEFVSPPAKLIAVGGVHITVALMSMAKTLGFHTVVLDPRSVWGNRERFPNIDRLIQAWPQDAFRQESLTGSTAIVTLTHDPKLDDPALEIALSSPAFYVGALGSKTTNAKRYERLLNRGISEAQLSRLHAPIGLNIGAETPEEIALAILSEVVRARRRRGES